LDYSNNQITGLPLELGNLKNLKVLNLSGNDFSEYDLNLIQENIPTVTVITD
jgi:Leucine-rich repeat (LRR) protein